MSATAAPLAVAEASVHLALSAHARHCQIGVMGKNSDHFLIGCAVYMWCCLYLYSEVSPEYAEIAEVVFPLPTAAVLSRLSTSPVAIVPVPAAVHYVVTSFQGVLND